MVDIIEIDGGVVDKCPKCGKGRLMSIEFSKGGLPPFVKGKKCYDCGAFLIPKQDEKATN